MEGRGLQQRDPCSSPQHRGRAAAQHCSLARHLPLGVGHVAGAGVAIPGTVWVPGQAALGTGFAVGTAAVQGQLGQRCGRASVELVLGEEQS